MSEIKPIKLLFDREDVKAKFTEMLGKRSTQFITSVLQIVSNNNLLSKADPISVYNSAAVAATLDLPINSSLGFAYIVPYKVKQSDGSYKDVAQFQLGYKGFIQLSQRSGQFKTINVTDVREGEIKKKDRLTGEYSFEWMEDDKERESKVIVGYVAYFELVNGFSKSLFMSIEKLKAHGTKFSQTYKKGFGLWKDDFDSMASKTVLKLLLSKFAPLSVEMQKAVYVDQAVINDDEAKDVTYVDMAEDKEHERIVLMLQDCKTSEEVDELQEKITASSPEIDYEIFAKRKEELRDERK